MEDEASLLAASSLLFQVHPAALGPTCPEGRALTQCCPSLTCCPSGLALIREGHRAEGSSTGRVTVGVGTSRRVWVRAVSTAGGGSLGRPLTSSPAGLSPRGTWNRRVSRPRGCETLLGTTWEPVTRGPLELGAGRVMWWEGPILGPGMSRPRRKSRLCGPQQGLWSFPDLGAWCPVALGLRKLWACTGHGHSLRALLPQKAPHTFAERSQWWQ